MNKQLKSCTRSFRLALPMIIGLASVVMICGESACKISKPMDTTQPKLIGTTQPKPLVTNQPEEQPLAAGTLHVGARYTYTVGVYQSIGYDATFATSDPAVLRIVDTRFRYLRPEPIRPGGDAAEKTAVFEALAPGEATVTVNKNYRGQLKEAVKIKVTVAPAPEIQPGKLWGDETEHFRMSLSVSSLSSNAMEPLIATVVIKNNAKEKQGFFWIGGFAITVRNASNEVMPATRYGKFAQEMSFVDPRFISWDSAESQTFQVVINRERDMTVQGTYSISISVPVLRDKENAPKLVSNLIKVKISDSLAASTEPETHEALPSPPK